MGRILFWVAVALAAYLAWRWWQRKTLRHARSAAAREPAAAAAESMLACRVCGLNVPASEAVRADGRAYCCEEHRADGERAR